jgi:hypothetical protein
LSFGSLAAPPHTTPSPSIWAHFHFLPLQLALQLVADLWWRTWKTNLNEGKNEAKLIQYSRNISKDSSFSFTKETFL